MVHCDRRNLLIPMRKANQSRCRRIHHSRAHQCVNPILIRRRRQSQDQLNQLV
jgi:hypothetical protein